MSSILRRYFCNLKIRKFHSANRELEGKVALVTGSTSGIGLSIAENLARLGCHIVLNGFGEPRAVADIQSKLQSHNIRTSYYEDDLSTIDGNIAFTDKVFCIHTNGVDILVNNAGIQHVSPVESFPVEKWEQMIGIMLTSPFILIQRFLPKMIERGWGRIINIASVHGHIASPYKAGYVSAKHGVLGLTKVVALETACSGITCNAVCPGFVDTQKASSNKIRGRSMQL